jgi:PhnB protein
MTEFRTGRAGYHSLTPRIVVNDLTAQVEFLRRTFDASGDVVEGRPVELRIGDSLLMVAEAGERDVFPAFLYVYVDDAGATYERAVASGASTIETPAIRPTATVGRWCVTRSATCSRSPTDSTERERSLDASSGRPPAKRFYERLGFVASHHGMKLALRPEPSAQLRLMNLLLDRRGHGTMKPE